LDDYEKTRIEVLADFHEKNRPITKRSVHKEIRRRLKEYDRNEWVNYKSDLEQERDERFSEDRYREMENYGNY
jgi:hypothetical protein